MPFDSDVPGRRPVQPPVQLPAEPGWYNDPTGAHSHQAYWDGHRWTGAVRPGVPNGATENSEPRWAGIVSLASGIGASAASLPFWLVLLVVVVARIRGRFFTSTSLSEGVMGFLLSEGVIAFLLGATSLLGLFALVFGWIAVGTRKRFTSGHRIGKVGMILGAVGAGSPWIILAFFVASLFELM